MSRRYKFIYKMTVSGYRIKLKKGPTQKTGNQEALHRDLTHTMHTHTQTVIYTNLYYNNCYKISNSLLSFSHTHTHSFIYGFVYPGFIDYISHLFLRKKEPHMAKELNYTLVGVQIWRNFTATSREHTFSCWKQDFMFFISKLLPNISRLLAIEQQLTTGGYLVATQANPMEGNKRTKYNTFILLTESLQVTVLFCSKREQKIIGKRTEI